jgi:glutamate carboxypeptidase
VANTTIVKGDLRFLTEDQRERVQMNMQAIVRESLPQTEGNISFEEEYYPAMPPTDGNMVLLQTLSQVSKDLAQGEVKPYDPGRRGAGDISFVAQYVDGLDGLGVIGGGAHAPGEWVHLPSIEDIVKRTALLIYRLSSSN